MSQKPSPAPLAIPLLANAGADQLALMANVRALECRATARGPRRQTEILALLQGAANVGQLDAAKGKLLLEQARQAYGDTLQVTNRIAFAVGALIGAVLVFAITVTLINLASQQQAWALYLAPPAMLFPLCSYALIGSLISIFSRLPKMDLKDTDSIGFVALSAAIQPLIALGFMAIVYILLRYEILGFKIAAADPNAVLWVTAFFCGFSERFAPGILGSAAALFTKPQPSH